MSQPLLGVLRYIYLVEGIFKAEIEVSPVTENLLSLLGKSSATITPCHEPHSVTQQNPVTF